MVCPKPASTVGVGLTVTILVSVTAAQGAIPVLVSVRVAVPLNPGGGVQVALRVLASGENVPPDGVDQVAPVADPPVIPFRGFVVPPWQIVSSVPASTVGVGLTITLISSEIS